MKQKHIFLLPSFALVLASCNAYFPSSSDDSSSPSLESSNPSSIPSSSSSPEIEVEDLDWNLVWADEFDDTGLPNPTKWLDDVGRLAGATMNCNFY